MTFPRTASLVLAKISSEDFWLSTEKGWPTKALPQVAGLRRLLEFQEQCVGRHR